MSDNNGDHKQYSEVKIDFQKFNELSPEEIKNVIFYTSREKGGERNISLTFTEPIHWGNKIMGIALGLPDLYFLLMLGHVDAYLRIEKKLIKPNG